MRITLPFKYEVLGIPPRARNPTSKRCLDNVVVDIPEVSPSDFEHALTLLSDDCQRAEMFHFYDGSFWIEDGRDDPSQLGDQHIMLAGRWPAKKCLTAPYHQKARDFKPFTQQHADEANRLILDWIATLGYLRLETANPYLQKHISNVEDFVDGPAGMECVPSDFEGEFRRIESNTINQERLKAVEYAQSNTVSVSGRLWHRVPKPVIYATDHKVDWRFADSFWEMPGYHGPMDYDRDRKDTSAYKAYTIAMCDEETIARAFPKQDQDGRVKFVIDFMDERFFESVDLRKGVIKDIDTAMRLAHGLSSMETRKIMKWCQLRDLIGNPKQGFDNRPDEFFDAAADILADMENLQMGEFAGAEMWADREVEMDIGTAPPSAKP